MIPISFNNIQETSFFLEVVNQAIKDFGKPLNLSSPIKSPEELICKTEAMIDEVLILQKNEFNRVCYAVDVPEKDLYRLNKHSANYTNNLAMLLLNRITQKVYTRMNY